MERSSRFLPNKLKFDRWQQDISYVTKRMNGLWETYTCNPGLKTGLGTWPKQLPQLCITASGHLCTISNPKNIKIVHYSINFCDSRSSKFDPNLCTYSGKWFCPRSLRHSMEPGVALQFITGLLREMLFSFYFTGDSPRREPQLKRSPFPPARLA